MGRPRTFDYAAAHALRRAGWTYPRIARALGVHHASVMYACDAYYRNRKLRTVRRYQGLAT